MLLAWADGLREIAMAEIGPKPAGYMPFTMFWPSGNIYPPENRFWLDERAHAYGVSPGKLWKYHFPLCSAYYFSRGRQFLEPIDRMMDLASMSVEDRVAAVNGFLGEMNLLSGQTVFLTAVVTEPMRYVAVDREAQRRLHHGRHDVENAQREAELDESDAELRRKQRQQRRDHHDVEVAHQVGGGHLGQQADRSRHEHKDVIAG